VELITPLGQLTIRICISIQCTCGNLSPHIHMLLPQSCVPPVHYLDRDLPYVSQWE